METGVGGSCLVKETSRKRGWGQTLEKPRMLGWRVSWEQGPPGRGCEQGRRVRGGLGKGLVS